MKLHTEENTGYSSFPHSFLCPRCQYGVVKEGSGGKTDVICEAGMAPARVTFAVTKCNKFRKIETQKMYDNGENLILKDGHVLVSHYLPGHGDFLVRAVGDNGKITTTAERNNAVTNGEVF